MRMAAPMQGEVDTYTVKRMTGQSEPAAAAAAAAAGQPALAVAMHRGGWCK
jgi:hypothetical protein